LDFFEYRLNLMPPRKKTFSFIYFLGFLWSLAFSLPLYVQSSFISSIVGLENVGLVVFISNLVSFLTLVGYGRLIRRFSNWRVAIGMVILNLLTVLFLVLSTGLWSIFLYIMVFITMNLFGVNLDLFLESISDDSDTGRIRTNMLAVQNVAIFLAPMLMGYIVGDNNYLRIYLIGGVIFFPVLFLLFYQKKLVVDRIEYNERSFRVLRQLFKVNKNIPRIFVIQFALRFFFAAMVLYTPIYLHDNLGFSWSQIGPMFTIMLLPFLLLQIPAGRIADKVLGEKEMTITGLIFMITFTTVIIFFSSESWLLWAFVLFLTRVGASLVEAMNESFFFKQISSQDVDIINMFRDLQPIGWLSAAAVTFVLLHYFSIISIFVAVVIILILALWPAIKLVDTK